MATSSAPTPRLTLQQLEVLRVLLEERHVSAAARRLGLSQSAMSHALAVLRRGLGDELLVPGASGMVLTSRGARLAKDLAGALRQLTTTLTSRARGLELEERTLTLAMLDSFALQLVPGVIGRAVREVPHVELDVRPPPRDGTAAALESGELDLVVEAAPHRQTPVSSRALRLRHLYDDDFVGVVRAGHPTLGRRTSLGAWLAAGHLLLSPKGEGRGAIDRALLERGLSRRVQLRMRSFVAALLVVSRTDLVLTAPRRLAASGRLERTCRVFELPVQSPSFSVWALWHERQQDDPLHGWLRSVIAATVGR